MADSDIIQNLILQLGQSQGERTPAELGVHYADVDERTPEELLAFTRKLAEFVRFYSPGDADAPSGNWTPLFPSVGDSIERYVEASAGQVPPHLALLLAFLDLYTLPQAIANSFTARHLDFYYQDVLRLRKKDAVPDRAHLLLELKKGAEPVEIAPANLFSAGKDATKVERLYAPVRKTVVNHARVQSLRNVFLDQSGRGTVRFSPIADSGDGLGGKLDEDEPGWHAFGSESRSPAEIGFAVAAPVLRMQEGERRATLRLVVSGADPARVTTANLTGAFTVYLTGAKGWIQPDTTTARVAQDGALEWELTLAAGSPAVVDYSAAVHGYAYAAAAPVVQLLLSSGGPLGYLDLEGVVVQSAGVTVSVSGVTSLAVESDAGAVDPTKAFLPFGAQPTAGSRFMVSYPEALAKQLSSLSLVLKWKDAPRDFGTHYSDYGGGTVSNASFTAGVAFEDGAGTRFSNSSAQLFDTANPQAEHRLTFIPGMQGPVFVFTQPLLLLALGSVGSAWSTLSAGKRMLASPVLSAISAAPSERAGYVTLTLNRSFLHAEYRKRYVEKVVTFAKSGTGTLSVPNEPYTPTVQSISLSYDAASGVVGVSTDSESDFADPDVQFFHLAPFGPLLDHGYQRSRLGFVAEKEVTLIPRVPHAGELLVGVADLAAGDSVSLLFQVAEGSADPDMEREELRWYVLSDNYWRELGGTELVLDTTNHLLTSGLVQVVVPTEATTTNTVLPAGLVWLKAAVPRRVPGVPSNVAAVSRLLSVSANALEVEFVDRGNDPAHLETALPAGTIAKLQTGLAAVKKVVQPYASFGGATVERDEAFYTRASERLRHKNRCITPWDYERVVLEAFPSVHRVKCIPHAREGSWKAPGHVMVVVVPDLRNQNATDPLQPKVAADTLTRITDHVKARAGMQVEVKVKNPRYQKVHLDFKVRFHTGCEFNYYRTVLQQALLEALSPWAFESGREISFGGVVYKSVLMDVVEELDYVDYVSDFRMYSYAGSTLDRKDLEEARPATPDTILVSDREHTITQAV